MPSLLGTLKFREVLLTALLPGQSWVQGWVQCWVVPGWDTITLASGHRVTNGSDHCTVTLRGTHVHVTVTEPDPVTLWWVSTVECGVLLCFTFHPAQPLRGGGARGWVAGGRRCVVLTVPSPQWHGRAGAFDQDHLNTLHYFLTPRHQTGGF